MQVLSGLQNEDFPGTAQVHSKVSPVTPSVSHPVMREHDGCNGYYRNQKKQRLQTLKSWKKRNKSSPVRKKINVLKSSDNRSKMWDLEGSVGKMVPSNQTHIYITVKWTLYLHRWGRFSSMEIVLQLVRMDKPILARLQCLFLAAGELGGLEPANLAARCH